MNTNAIISFQDIASAAGFAPAADGKLALPNSQDAADALAVAARRIVLGGADQWTPGMDAPGDVTLTGAGPVWAYLAVAHALHGVVRSLTYASPAATIVVYSHQAPA